MHDIARSIKLNKHITSIEFNEKKLGVALIRVRDVLHFIPIRTRFV